MNNSTRPLGITILSGRWTRCLTVATAISLSGLVAPDGFAQSSTDELSREQILELEEREALRLIQLQDNPEMLYRSRIATLQTACSNGAFELGLDPNEWTGGHGTVIPSSGDPDFANFTASLTGGNLNEATAHQTWTTVGTDPTGISQVAPFGLQGPGDVSSRSVRIGNARSGRGSELLSKTFTVTAAESVIKFWYAAVFEDPGHPVAQQPSFWVRVLDSTGTEVPNLVNFGNNSDKIVSNQTNPFFEELENSNPTVVYRDWSCAEINLSEHIGQTVTVQFITEDCTQSGHYGYAYIDNFCGTCQGDKSGSITLDQSPKVACGMGDLCFDYTLPVAGDSTGTATIELTLMQSGAVVSTIASPTLATGTRHCFSIDPSSINLTPGPSSFDFMATATFSISGTTLAPKTVGTMQDGFRPGRNNDYEVECSCDQVCCLAPCCVEGDCVETTERSCNGIGGLFQPDESSCKIGKCRLGDLCFSTSRTRCLASDGVWLGDKACPPDISL